MRRERSWGICSSYALPTWPGFWPELHAMVIIPFFPDPKLSLGFITLSISLALSVLVVGKSFH